MSTMEQAALHVRKPAETINVQLPSCKNDSSKKDLMRCNGVDQFRLISLNECMFTSFKCIFCAAICSTFE